MTSASAAPSPTDSERMKTGPMPQTSIVNIMTLTGLNIDEGPHAGLSITCAGARGEGARSWAERDNGKKKVLDSVTLHRYVLDSLANVVEQAGRRNSGLLFSTLLLTPALAVRSPGQAR